jgi:16S rRNA (adenine1518-N6/adenine1519-N6)-dimethyltransferase
MDAANNTAQIAADPTATQQADAERRPSVLTSPRVLRDLLAAHGLRPRKRLGQHFLVDGNVLAIIVGALAPAPGDRLLEIGAGVGTLTRPLADSGAQVTAVELDDRLAPVLAETVGDRPNLRLLRGDVLALDLDALLVGGRWKIAGNLPYYITTPIIARLLERHDRIERMVFTMQREVADRMAAPPGGRDYGALSVLAQFRCQVERVAAVSRHCFYPEPEVESVIVRLNVRAQPAVAVADEQLFFAVVRAAFGQRRKTLANALAGADLPLPQPAADLLRSVGIAPGRRGETLSLDEFARIADRIREEGS